MLCKTQSLPRKLALGPHSLGVGPCGELLLQEQKEKQP